MYPVPLLGKTNESIKTQIFISEIARIKAAIFIRLDKGWEGLGQQNTIGFLVPPFFRSTFYSCQEKQNG